MPYRFKVFNKPEHVSLEKNILKNDIHCTDEEYQMKDEKKKKKKKNILISSIVDKCFALYTVLYVYRSVTACPS